MLLMVCLHFRFDMQIVAYNEYIYPEHKLLQVEQFPVDSLLGHMKIHFQSSHFYIYMCKRTM